MSFGEMMEKMEISQIFTFKMTFLAMATQTSS